MAKFEQGSIGKRLGRLLQQYELRITYAKYKAGIYDQERNNASALNQSSKASKASLAQNCWANYCKNLMEKREQLIAAIQQALIGYNDKQRKMWVAYFIENKSPYEIGDEMSLHIRNVQRFIASAKSDMELRFTKPLPETGERPSPQWTANDLANYLTSHPSDDYDSAVKDLLDYGIIDLDALESDQEFQDYLGGKQ